MQLDITDHLSMGGILVAAFSAVRALERVFNRWMNKKHPEEKNVTTTVQLNPEISVLIRETHEGVYRVEEVVNVRDANGAPMVYAPRAIMGRVEEKLDKLLEKK